MYKLLTELFPYNRSITGDGVRKTIERISLEIPIKETHIKSGTNVFDWTVPDEWNVYSAKIYDPNGVLIVDFENNNLFLMSYSIPVNDTLSLKELKEHIITDQTRPDWVPYSTSYYKDEWAFCLPFNFVKEMIDGDYVVEINSTKKFGELNYAEAFVDNNAEKDVLISAYICHPSMANDSLSGVVLSVQLYKEIEQLSKETNLKYNYRFLFTPETIGTICFLEKNKIRIKKLIEYGLVATCLGDVGDFTYKKTKNGKQNIDRIVEYVFKKNKRGKLLDFSPLGSDERQYCSPGFDLPVGVLTRSMYGQFPEYHTSADNLDFVTSDSLQESLHMYLEVIKTYEANCKYVRSNPYCEPQMGKYDLYRETGGAGKDSLDDVIQQYMWILNYADNVSDLLEISEKSGYGMFSLQSAAKELLENKLIKLGDEIAK
jgi:aminopeptidase-like protein